MKSLAKILPCTSNVYYQQTQKEVVRSVSNKVGQWSSSNSNEGSWVEKHRLIDENQYKQICCLLSLEHQSTKAYISCTANRRILSCFPSTAARLRDERNFVENCVKNWWLHFGRKATVHELGPTNMSIILNGLEKLNRATDGRLLNILGYQAILEISKGALNLNFLPHMMPKNYYRILQSINKLYSKELEDEYPGKNLHFFNLKRFLTATFDVFLRSRCIDISNFNEECSSGDLQVEFLYLSTSFTFRLLIPHMMMVFSVNEKLQETQDGSFCWFTMYNCLKAALMFDQWQSFKETARGLWYHRLVHISQYADPEQIDELIDLVTKKRFGDKFLLLELRNVERMRNLNKDTISH